EQLDAAPAAPSVLADARSIIEELPVVGHNVLAQLSHVNYELLWHGLPPLRNDLLDTQQIAAQRFPDLTRPSLAAIGGRVGLRAPRVGAGPYGMSRYVAEVYVGLVRTMTAPVAPRADAAHVEYAYRSLPPGAGVELPELPGVYVMRDAAGAALYVGKATSLRSRVPQHFTGASRAARLDDGLIARVAYVEHEVTGTEAAARRRELDLIREHTPPYNTQRAAHLGKRYLVLRNSPYPRAAASAGPIEGAETYGPYRTSAAVRETMRALATVFQLRTCLRALPTKKKRLRVPCIRLGMGLCPAPCAGELAADRYALRVDLARAFLRDGQETLLEAIDSRLSNPDLDGDARPLLADVRARLKRLTREHRPLEDGPDCAAAPR
ncbi:MAG TPA: GIY-YIG nuclease family protein, partial [Chloroflexota bacterium]|nr:GIY-YIG nuclease family protein [Chloroflexota bacterium]